LSPQLRALLREFALEPQFEASPLSKPISGVRDVTAQVLNSLANVPRDRRYPAYSRVVGHHPDRWPPTSWESDKVTGYHFIASPLLTPGDRWVPQKLSFEKPNTIRPDAENLIFEVAGVKAPKLIAVSWPRRIAPAAQARPTPFLIYMRPMIKQKIESRYGGMVTEGPGFYVGPDGSLGTYPYGWDFLFYGFWSFLNYWGDPLTRGQNTKGLPYQIAASGKDAVLIMPLNAPPKVDGSELGEFMRAGFVQQLLKDIQTFMFRRHGLSSVPPLGRIALAAFSSGNDLAAQFVNLNINHPFVRDNLMELYMFDAPVQRKPDGSLLAPTWWSSAARWAAPGSTVGPASKMIRAYVQDTYPIPLLGGMDVPAQGSFVIKSRDSLLTIARLTRATWGNKRTEEQGDWPWEPKERWGMAHQLISATMLTDALQRSGFPQSN
jgi:hypothetical protein